MRKRHTPGTKTRKSSSDGAVHAGRALSYDEYLKVAELLSLQERLSKPAHHDEMLFIIIHQSYELWFKLILYELGEAAGLMKEREILKARHFINRCVEVLKTLVRQIHILETITPVDFLGFRDRLRPASGFQSVQFRELEFLCGLKDPALLEHFEAGSHSKRRLEQRLLEPDLSAVYLNLLKESGYRIPANTREGHLESNPDKRDRFLDEICKIYKESEKNLPLFLLTESLLDLDEAFGLWREHHVRVVERIIGLKTGTGGSPGVPYLRTTLSKQCFPYLWRARTRLGIQP